jgi:hypothetical protein
MAAGQLAAPAGAGMIRRQSSLLQQVRQFRGIERNPPRLVAG